MNRQFSKEEAHMANKCMKKCSIWLTIKEIPIKITLRLHLTPVKTVIINNTTTTNVGEDMGEKEHLYTFGGSVN
jgi:hypothetical protein